jgi:hypothetical protein
LTGDPYRKPGIMDEYKEYLAEHVLSEDKVVSVTHPTDH